MRISYYYWAFACVLVLFAPTAYGQSIKSSLGCDKSIQHDTEYSAGGEIRVDQAFICVGRNGKNAALHYRASAMVREKFTGTSDTPWLTIKILDRNGTELYSKSNFDLPDVERCGGYQGHWKAIPIGNRAGQIYSFELSMGGTRGQSCNPQGFDRVKYDVDQALSRWSRGELTDSERLILSVITQGGS